jgi:hypothetical protein
VNRVVLWKRLDGEGLEYATIDGPPLRIEGEVVLLDDGAPCAVSYRVDCDPSGASSRATVRLKQRGTVRERTLARSAGGMWTIDGADAPELLGLEDVDVAVTPSTNTLPLRRLALPVGARAEVTAAWVRFPSLDVVPLRQAYRRIAAGRYDYESPDHGFRAELTVDDEGIVQTYGALWTVAGVVAHTAL